MKIDLADLSEKDVSSIDLEGEINKDFLDIGGRKIFFLEPIKYNGAIYKAGKDKIVHVNISYTYREICGRCLEPFVKTETTVLSGQLIRQQDIFEDGTEEVIYYEDDEIDLTEDIINTIVLSLPMKPLCSEECKGMCPRCGANLNKEKCDCVVEDIDPRMAILKNFMIDN